MRYDKIPAMQAFQEASALHMQGKLQEAEQLYRVALTCRDLEFFCIYRLGIVRLQQDNINEAEQLFRQSIGLNDKAPEAYHHHGISLLRLGRPEEASLRFHTAIELKPELFESHDSLGHALLALGRTIEAIEHYRKAVAVNPNHAPGWNSIGNALRALGESEYEQAFVQFRKAFAACPIFSDTRQSQPFEMAGRERYEVAVSYFRRALAIIPEYAEAHFNLGTTLIALDRNYQAIEHLERVIAIDPDNAMAHIILSRTFLALDRSDEAIVHCNMALMLASMDAVVLRLAAEVHWKLNRHEEALNSWDKFLAIRPKEVRALIRRANVLHELGQVEKSLADVALAQAIDPSCADAHAYEGHIRLRMGEFQGALEKYEWRLKQEDNLTLLRNFDQPMWSGMEDITGKTILIIVDQGLGDTIQFCRYAELLGHRGARVVLEVQPSLKSLLGSLSGVEKVLAQGEPLPDFDYYCPVTSLPFAFKMTLDTIPAKVPYLSVSANRISQWERRLGPRTKPRVGLVWSGNPGQTKDHQRSMPLRDLVALVSPEFEFVSLQKHVGTRDLDVLNGHSDILHFADELENFSDTAALVCSMDLVISVCTSVGHLAGSLNKPTWFLLCAAADWRWLLDRNDSPWYPSVRLFRQRRLGDWKVVVDELVGELAQFGKASVVGAS